MSNLYIDRKNIILRNDGGCIGLYDAGGKQGSIPLGPLDRIVIVGNATLETSLLSKLSEEGVSLMILSGRKHQLSMMLGNYHNDAERRVNQYAAFLDDSFRVQFSRTLVKNKLLSQLRQLQQFLMTKTQNSQEKILVLEDKFQNLMSLLPTTTTLQSLRGIEGSAAKLYFSTLSGIVPESLNFFGRNKRPPRDPINAALSLGYTVLYGEAIAALHCGGLDPFIGFYHDLHYGRASLACDCIEPLRVKVDDLIFNLFSLHELRLEHFSINSQGCSMGKVARTTFYQSIDPIIKSVRTEMESWLFDLIKELEKRGHP